MIEKVQVTLDRKTVSLLATLLLQHVAIFTGDVEKTLFATALLSEIGTSEQLQSSYDEMRPIVNALHNLEHTKHDA